MKNKVYFSLLILALAWWEPMLPSFVAGTGARAVAADILSYTLVNADTNQDLFTLTPGIALDLATLPTRNLNIRANTNPTTVGSVVFSLTGTQTHAQTENVAPYALFSDVNGVYNPWTPLLGNYSLVATPYDGPSGTGTSGAPLTLTFSVVSSVAAVASFTLVNANNGLDLFDLTPDITVNLSTLPTTNVNIRANTNQLPVGSVVLDLSGPVNRLQTENVVPYALFSDLNGTYFPWRPIAGSYSLTGTPFSGAGGSGTAGLPLTINFTFTGAPLAVQLAAFTAEAQGPGAVQLRWTTASEENNKEFVVERSTNGRIFSAVTSVAGHGTSAGPHDYRYEDKQLPDQAPTLYYRLRQVDTDGTTSFSPVRALSVAAQPAAFQVFSSPAADGAVHYTFSGPTTGAEQLEVYTMLGQRRGQYAVAAGGAGMVPVSGLPPGIYVLRLLGATHRCEGRFVLP